MRNKYGAKKTIIDGFKFDSKAEARRYQELKLLEQAGEIKSLSLQVSFEVQEPLLIRGTKIRAINYVADFVYDDKTNGGVFQSVCEDVKGVKTGVYNLKKKLFLSAFGDKFLFRESYEKGNSFTFIDY